MYVASAERDGQRLFILKTKRWIESLDLMYLLLELKQLIFVPVYCYESDVHV